MIDLPKRPGPYLLTLLVIVLGILTFWMFQVLTDPAISRAAEELRKERKKREPEPSPVLPSLPIRSTAIDPMILEMHQKLVASETSPEQELEILQELLNLNQRALGSSGLGDNSDVTRALLGEGPQGTWLPRNSPRLRDGLLLDRWGSPYWFHANAVNQIEIRSPGPDRNLFTSDDVILNPSPAGFGVTP